jgi:hypothetical protein
MKIEIYEYYVMLLNGLFSAKIRSFGRVTCDFSIHTFLGRTSGKCSSCTSKTQLPHRRAGRNDPGYAEWAQPHGVPRGLQHVHTDDIERLFRIGDAFRADEYRPRKGRLAIFMRRRVTQWYSDPSPRICSRANGQIMFYSDFSRTEMQIETINSFS